MTNQLTVILDDRVAGTLTRLDQGRLRFDYDDDYRTRPDATPLSVSMPTQVASHSDRVVTPWLWGLLPDNEAVLSRWARQFHVSSSSPFSLLSTPVGEDCAGSVRFAPPDELDRVLERPGTVTWLDEEGVAQRLRELREDSTAWLGRTFTGQFSLAGAQAKTALLYENGTWGVPAGATPTTHILKPAVAGFDDHDLNEHLCLDAARRCGLRVARTHVEQFAGESAIVVDRYDRVNRRHHFADPSGGPVSGPRRATLTEVPERGGTKSGRYRKAHAPRHASEHCRLRCPQVRRRPHLELDRGRHRRSRQELLVAPGG